MLRPLSSSHSNEDWRTQFKDRYELYGGEEPSEVSRTSQAFSEAHLGRIRAYVWTTWINQQITGLWIVIHRALSTAPDLMVALGNRTGKEKQFSTASSDNRKPWIQDQTSCLWKMENKNNNRKKKNTQIFNQPSPCQTLLPPSNLPKSFLFILARRGNPFQADMSTDSPKLAL